MNWVARIFDRTEPTSKAQAKQRLKLVLMHDRASISPRVMDELKEELLSVIKKYIDIDINGTDISLDEDQKTVALIANIPIKGLRNKQAN